MCSVNEFELTELARRQVNLNRLSGSRQIRVVKYRRIVRVGHVQNAHGPMVEVGTARPKIKFKLHGGSYFLASIFSMTSASRLKAFASSAV